MPLDSKGVEYDNEFKLLKQAPIGLTNYIVPKSCETIRGGSSAADSPFILCSSSLTKVSFTPDSNLKTVNSYAFSKLSALKGVNFSNCNQLTSLSTYLFSESKALSSIILPPNLQYFANLCFHQCTSLETMKVPDSVLKLSYMMIISSGIKTLEISENSNIETIETEALCGTQLTSFFVAKNVTKLDGSMFALSNSIENITIHKDNHNFNKIGKSIFSSDMKTLLLTRETGKIEVPNTVQKLAFGCFRGNNINEITFAGNSMESFDSWFFAQSQLMTFTFPRGITSVPYMGFAWCARLTTVVLTEDIKTISSSAFSYCTNLGTIDLMNVTTLRSSCFACCGNLESIVLPPSVDTIDSGAFSQCKKIKVNCSLNEKYEIANGMFFVDQKKTLSEFFDSYENVTIPSNCEVVGPSAFYERDIKRVSFDGLTKLSIKTKAFSKSKLEEIDFPGCLSSIDSECFKSCGSLKRVSFSDCSLEKIPDYCFYECTNLEELNIPSTIKSIGKSAFYNCVSLMKLDFEDTQLTEIAEFAFTKCGILKYSFSRMLKSLSKSAFSEALADTINLASTQISTIPQTCFYNCYRLTQFYFAEMTSTIELQAFSGCSNLQSITLSKNIEVIGISSFENCITLQSFELPLDCNLKEIKVRAFSNCTQLTEIHIDPSDSKLVFDLGALMSKDKTRLIFFLPTSSTSVYVIPAPVQEIGPSAFEGCTNLRMVTIPEGNIKVIQYRAFAGCTKLSFIYLPKSITTIASQAFDECKSLKCGSIYTSNSETVNSLLMEAGVNPLTFSMKCNSRKTMKMCKCSSNQNNIILLIILIEEAGK